jgi:hypothetical protein
MLPRVALEHGQSRSTLSTSFPGNIAIDAGLADLEAGTQGIVIVCDMQVNFGIDGNLRQRAFRLCAASPNAFDQAGRARRRVVFVAGRQSKRDREGAG